MESTNQDAAVESCDSVPALVVTQVEEPWCSAPPEASSAVKTEEGPPKPHRPVDVYPSSVAPLSQDVSPGPGSTDADMSCSDLLSLKSDSVSITGSRRSEESQEDDVRSVTASSVMSLCQRLQLDPLEKDWIKSCASGNASVQRLLLSQEPGLVLKKDFITGFTALHWAAKHGLQETLDLMIRSGADVNARSHGGYTALHLASIHGHRHIVLALVNIYNAKTNTRDYHGKKAAHYWNGSTDIFNKLDVQTVLPQWRRTLRYTVPSLPLPQSRSQEHIQLEFGLHHSASQDLMEIHV